MAPRTATREQKAAPRKNSRKVQMEASTVNASEAIGTILIAAVVSTCSLASMSPIYGSIPSGAFHGLAMAASTTAGFLFHNTYGPGAVSVIRENITCLIVTPALHRVMYGSSERLGPVLGPLVLGLLTCHSTLAVTAYVFAAFRTGPRHGPGSNTVQYTMALAYFVSVYGLHRVLQSFLPTLLMRCNTWNAAPWDHMSPTKLQVILLSILLPLFMSRTRTLLKLGILSLAATFTFLGIGTILKSAESTTDWHSLGWTWSNTGYISVLENTAQDYRALRCDHSLLGGEWLVNDERRRQNWKVNEPIYHVFEMLEAVRLVQTDTEKLDKDANALVIGLGIGTAPKALIHHGIDTTIVELDPIVHKYAVEYFDLPTNHTAVIQDAISWTSERAGQRTSPTFHYILHDVFTGGAEPLPLFTHTFISNLRRLLSPDGVIAINYAGELSLPLTRRILHTVDSVFEGQCSAYADANPNEGEHDFLNMVIFCRNTAGPIEFRTPTTADFLESISRRNYLLPNPQNEVAIPGRNKDEEELEIFHEHEMKNWAKQQRESAVRHWHTMRQIIPSAVWERY